LMGHLISSCDFPFTILVKRHSESCIYADMPNNLRFLLHFSHHSNDRSDRNADAQYLGQQALQESLRNQVDADSYKKPESVQLCSLSKSH
jgi:hypothetical protein